MVLPIRAQTKTLSNTRFRYEFRSWSAQKAPYDRALPFDYTLRVGTDGLRRADARNAFYDPITGSPNIAQANTLAYEKFKNAVADQAGLLVNLYQRQQTVDMLTSRLNQLARFTNAVRRKEFSRAARELGLKKPPKPPKYMRTRAASANWLEYHFGWEPVIRDVYTCVDLLQQDFSDRRVRGTSPKIPSRTESSNYGTGIRVIRQWETQVRISAVVRITNPNLYLANQLGLLNPVAVIWDAIPFSFVWDWFNTLSLVLNSYSDFLGLVLLDATTGTYVTVSDTQFMYTDEGRPRRSFAWQLQYKHDYTRVRRVLGLTGPSVVFRPLKRVSITRAATAAALLLNLLP